MKNKKAYARLREDEKGTPSRANSMSKVLVVRNSEVLLRVIVGSSEGSCTGMCGNGRAGALSCR